MKQDQDGQTTESPEPFALAMFAPEFNAEKVSRERDAAFSMAEQGAKEPLKALLRMVWREACRTHRHPTADVVWKILDIRPTIATGRPLGPIIQQSAKIGMIRLIKFDRSKRPGAHGKAIGFWRSLIFDPQAIPAVPAERRAA